MMTKHNLLSDIANKAHDLLGGTAEHAKEDIEQNLKALIGSALTKLDLITRAEFDDQMAVLRHTRERVEVLESKVAELEQQLAPHPEAEECQPSTANSQPQTSDDNAVENKKK